MDIFEGAYTRSLSQNEEQSLIWKNHLKALKDLNLSIFLDKMKVPALVPIGSRLLFRGEIVHTNEITVSLGAGYFAKCSVKQAEIIQQYRIKRAEENLKALKKEKEYLKNHLSFSKKNVLDETEKDIVEEYKEEDEMRWRVKHRENIKRLKEEERKSRESGSVTDCELWERLEELELKEELERECNLAMNESKPRFYFRECSEQNKPHSEQDESQNGQNEQVELQNGQHKQAELPNFTVSSDNSRINENPSIFCDNRQDIDINVISSKDNKQNRILELKKRLSEVRNQETVLCVTEEDVFKRLDLLEYQETLEDELDMLEDESDYDDEESGSSGEVSSSKLKKSITFASDYDDECIEIHFKHSDNSVAPQTCDKNAGILTPSDIYSAFPENFTKKSTVSILKRREHVQTYREIANETADEKPSMKQPVQVNVVGEVQEKIEEKENKVVTSERPVSKFRAMRMKKK